MFIIDHEVCFPLVDLFVAQFLALYQKSVLGVEIIVYSLFYFCRDGVMDFNPTYTNNYKRRKTLIKI